MLDAVTEGIAKILQHIWQALFVVPFEFWSDWVGKILETAAIFWAKLIAKHALKFVDALDVPDTMDASMKANIEGLLKEGTVGSVFAALFYLLPWTGGYILNTFQITNQNALRDVMALYKPSLPDISSVIQLMWRHPDKKEELRNIFGWQGFPDEQIENMLHATKPLLNPNEIIQLLHRLEIDPKRCDEMLSHWGFNNEDISHIKTLGNVIPALPDLVRMAVREVFSPEVAEKFGQFEDFPSEFAEWGQKQGLSRDWCVKIWGAHWDLPSVGMGYEMLHRGVIDENTLDLLLRAQDVMPYWRDKLKQISYKPYTRVDVRRMYAFGVLDEKAVYQAYRDVGYNDERALKMTEFTVKYTDEKEKDLTKSEYLDMLKKKIIDERECKSMLIEMGYDEREAELLIQRALYEKEKKIKELSIGNVRKLYMNGVYSNLDTTEKLMGLNLQGTEIDDLLKLWDIEKGGKSKTLPLSELKIFLQKKVMSPKEWVEVMKSLDYNNKQISWIYHGVLGEEINEDILS